MLLKRLVIRRAFSSLKPHPPASKESTPSKPSEEGPKRVNLLNAPNKPKYVVRRIQLFASKFAGAGGSPPPVPPIVHILTTCAGAVFGIGSLTALHHLTGSTDATTVVRFVVWSNYLDSMIVTLIVM
jgi:hypothetical protein